MVSNKLLSVVAIVIAFYLSSCQTAHEIHHFKVGANYYRVKIEERSFSSKARYISGYFDEASVDRYFGEMSQPSEKANTRAADVSFLKPSGNNERLRIDSNRKLVMILSTNSKAVADQIGAFAENERMLESIAWMANKSKIEESNKYAADITNGYQRNIAIKALGDQFISTLPANGTKNTVQTNVNVFLQFLKDKAGNNAPMVEALIRKYQK